MTAIAIIILLLMLLAVLSERWQWIPFEIKDFLGQLGGMLTLCVLIIGLLFGVLLGGCLLTDKVISTHSLSTKDAPGFSEDGFARINVGMSAGTVKTIIGEPLSISRKTAKNEGWWYTGPKGTY